MRSNRCRAPECGRHWLAHSVCQKIYAGCMSPGWKCKCGIVASPFSLKIHKDICEDTTRDLLSVCALSGFGMQLYSLTHFPSYTHTQASEISLGNIYIVCIVNINDVCACIIHYEMSGSIRHLSNIVTLLYC